MGEGGRSGPTRRRGRFQDLGPRSSVLPQSSSLRPSPTRSEWIQNPKVRGKSQTLSLPLVYSPSP